MREPVAISVALGAVLSTGVALLGLYIALTPEQMAVWIAFGNAVIALGVAVYARANVTPTAAPVLPTGTAVTTPGGMPASVTRLYPNDGP
jgi:hypothetical protein